MTDAGSTSWRFAVKDDPVEKIRQYVSEPYQGERAAIERGVQELMSQLLQENLIVSLRPEELVATFDDGIKISSAAERSQFRYPVLQKYTDMQALLLLDPVHDVDEAVWPRKP